MEKKNKTRFIVAGIFTVLCLLMAFLPFEGLESPGKGVMIVFTWAILMWIIRPIPEYLVGILSAAILAIFFGQKTDVVSGFSNGGWWLCLWAGFIGSAIQYTGLGERVAYWILVKMGKTELMANYATNIANTVLSLMIPSNTARGAVMSPMCDAICDGMGYKRGEHKGDAAIMLSNLYTNTTNTWLFYTAVGANAIGMALVTEATGKSISWIGWLQATWIPATIILLFIPWYCYKLYGPKKADRKPVDIQFAKDKLASMGKLSKNETKAAIYFILTLIAFCTNKWTNVSPNYVVFVTVFLLLCPGIGVCTFKDINKTFAWPAFLQLGFAMSLATCVSNVGGFQWIVDKIFTNNPSIANMNITTFLIIWLAFVVFLHIIFAGMNAMEAVIVPVSMTMASALGFDMYTMGLLTVMAISVGAYFLPFNSAPNLIFYSTDRFTTAQELKGAIPLAILTVLGLTFCVEVWFPIIGIL
jgi:anion transporter